VDQVLLSDEQAADLSNYLSTDEVNAGYQQAKKKQDTLDLFK
jgi:cytochrome c553